MNDPPIFTPGRQALAASRRSGLFRKTVLFSCIVTIVPVVTFVSRVIPAQKEILLDNLESQSKSLAASIYEITVASIIAEDYSPAIEQCNKVIKESSTLQYIVITRRQDGFSLVITRDGWRQRDLNGLWRQPQQEDRGVLRLMSSELAEGRVLHYAYPIVYLNWDWGWIHLGISPAQFNTDLSSIYRKTVSIAILSMMIGVAGSFYFSRRLTRPIRMLSENIRRIADGDLSPRVRIATGDETETLAEAFNGMAESLERSRAELTAAKNFTENIIRSTIGMLIVLGPDGTIRFVNRSALQLLDYAEADLMGQPFAKIFADHRDETAGEDDSVLRTIMERGSVACLERSFIRRDGLTVPALFSASKMQNDGVVEALVCSAVDITDLKHAAVELEKLHQDLVDASRVAGMAEVANNVLHNVGNVLNSVNVSGELLREKAGRFRGRALARTVQLLNEHHDDLTDFMNADPKGMQILPYLESLAVQMDADQKAVQAELVTLTGRIDHIKEIVAMQQNYSRLFGIQECVDIGNLVEDALRMSHAALVRHEITVKRDYRDVPPVTADKHKILQILVNLIRNAKYAMDESSRPERCLRLHIEPVDRTHVQVRVIDNGVGMTPEVRQRLFEYGFTTKSTGNGYGLHSSILAARALGGTLNAHSDGPGLGATFTLQIPIDAGDPSHD
jgi:PAS domain S-box-containing protein